VHRALIRALGLGDDGLAGTDIARLKDTAERITLAERRAMAAERDATDRYVAAFLSERVGATFEGRITGVTRFGLFVRLAETGADGLVPIASLGTEYFIHDERAHALVGERTGALWRLGRAVEVRLKEATPITGGLLFEMLSEPETGEAVSRGRPRRAPRRQTFRRGRRR
jgi:ribonuclease R